MATYASLKYDFGTQLTGEIPTAAIANDAVTLAKMASGTDGNIITYDASGNPAVVASGTSGHFLKSQGADTVPVFAAGGGSGRILQTAMKQYGDSVRTSSTSYVYMTPMHRSFASLDSTSSKVLVSLTGGTIGDGSDTGSYRFYAQINDTGGFSAISNELARPHESNNRYGNIAMQYLWSPSTTDKVEVQVWGKSIGGNLVGINVADVNIMMLMYEIGG
tara:strand:- start:226 stop:882 length:657 start_codon:yes stop_codon:yes gene_type:complete